MKILFVTNLYGSLARGGAERIVAQEAEALARAGHGVVVVSGEPRRDIPKGVCLPGEPWLCPPPGNAADIAAAYDAHVAREAKPGVPREIRFHPANIAFYSDLGKHWPPFRFLWHLIDAFGRKSGLTFASILGYERPDVVHTHNLMGLGFAIPGVLRRAGVRHVHTVHDVQLLDPSGLIRADRSFSPALHQKVYIATMRNLMGSPDTVIFPSKYLHDLYFHFGFFPKSRLVVLRNPASPPGARRTVPASPRRFLYVGQLEPHKGVMVLLDAWEKKNFDATLEIVGGGSLDARARKRAETLPNIGFLGRLDRDGVDAAYGRADWVVAPSTVVENAPSVLMEALGRGLPAVASNAGGIPELVRDGENGWLCVPGDAISLASSLAKAVSAGSYATMSARAVASVEGLDLASHLGTLQTLYAR